jgi:hypothetical protein
VERRDFNLKIRAVDDKGTFVGLGAVYGNVDLGGDVIDAGAFSRTLSAGKSFAVAARSIEPNRPLQDHRHPRRPSGQRHTDAFRPNCAEGLHIHAGRSRQGP